MNHRLSLLALVFMLLASYSLASPAQTACQTAEVKGSINAVLDNGFTFDDLKSGETYFVAHVPGPGVVPLSVGVRVEGLGCSTASGGTPTFLADVWVAAEEGVIEKVELSLPTDTAAGNPGGGGGGTDPGNGGGGGTDPGNGSGGGTNPGNGGGGGTDPGNGGGGGTDPGNGGGGGTDPGNGGGGGTDPGNGGGGGTDPGNGGGGGTDPGNGGDGGIDPGNGGGTGQPAGFVTISQGLWDTTAVRKVLQVFAYGGDVSDAQIAAWAAMPPELAIGEMLNFDCTGPCGLQELRALWSSTDPNNLVRPDRRRYYAVKQTQANGMPTERVADGTHILSSANLQNTWIAAVNKQGLNPFRQKVGLWLTNYWMAVSLRNVRPPLIASFYDATLDALVLGASFDQVLALGAAEAAVARQYGHQTNTYNNRTGLFRGNDDFAREFHQLFLHINGDGEDPAFHENVTIENTALLLTGMQIDRDPLAFGGNLRGQDQYVAPIDFLDHRDAASRNLRNRFRHHQADLEILRSPPGPGGTPFLISGFNAEDKLYALASAAIEYEESLKVLPVRIIEFFADDNITPDKADVIRAHWQGLQPKDLLAFLQDYAISTTFHRPDTFKYRSAFSRNTALYNLNTPDDGWAYADDYPPANAASMRMWMQGQGAQAFIPAKAVFGGQTGVDAANSPDLFKQAHNLAVDFSQRQGLENPLARTYWVYTPASPSSCPGRLLNNGRCQVRKDWAAVIPASQGGGYLVKDVAWWLWERLISDGGKHYGLLEEAHVSCLLATGFDCGYVLDPNNPGGANVTLTDLGSLANSLGAEPIALDAANAVQRREANRRVGMAINFISVTPYMFAIEGQ